MKSWGAYFATLLLVFTGLDALAESRTFTNKQGQTIEAEITTVRGGKVYLKQGGRNFAVAFDQFTAEDQAFIRKWVEDNFEYRLQFQAVETERKEMRQSTRDRQKSKRDSTESETWRYDVKITNRSGVDLKDLNVEYFIVVRDTHSEDTASSGREKVEKAVTFSGSETVATLANSDSVEFSSREIGLRKHEWEIQKSRVVNQSSSNLSGDVQYFWDEYSDEQKLDGIWVRVYLGDRLISEWKSEGKLIKEVAWKGAAPKANVAAAPRQPGALPPGLKAISQKISEKSREVSRDPQNVRLRRELEALLKERVEMLKNNR